MFNTGKTIDDGIAPCKVLSTKYTPNALGIDNKVPAATFFIAIDFNLGIKKNKPKINEKINVAVAKKAISFGLVKK